MVNSPALLETCLHGYNLFRTQSTLSPVEQEVVFLTIGRENGCHYCLAAHSTLAGKASGVPAEVTDAIRAGTALPDARLDALSEFTRIMLDSRGWSAASRCNRAMMALERLTTPSSTQSG
ncbi:carboxymuconolactone decarboxylase family protein [Zobellella sp. DQSA1]|uniref:carboxymuconolactone decarboxylase family protein n=1 Tax=Zobellella sp. DQSA1 TaxID=3342386 RepID=UPI0035BF7A09